jgi:hypothetical protein
MKATIIVMFYSLAGRSGKLLTPGGPYVYVTVEHFENLGEILSIRKTPGAKTVTNAIHGAGTIGHDRL